MKSRYKPAEIKSAIALKSLSTIGIAKMLCVSRRSIDYFINDQMGMNRGDEFIKILQPELGEIHKTYNKYTKKSLQGCEEK
ncbi:MAG: hypothetical protein K8S56_00435 [Candidatus Cloacimonetes bacterium]|nr:hypothetical protein [Candidatus Cloacimonadota bacterium]